MEYLDSCLCPDVVDNIYKQIHKSYITEVHNQLIHKLSFVEVHKELHNCFEGLYKVNLYEMKYDEVCNDLGEWHAQAWLDTAVKQKTSEVYEEHPNAIKLSKIYSDQQQKYLMEKYISDDEYELDGWWEYNKGYYISSDSSEESDESDGNEHWC